MKRKIILIINLILIMLTATMLNAATNIGLLDDAKSLNYREKQIGGFFGFQFTPYSYIGDLYDDSYSFEYSVIPINYTSFFTKNKIIPMPTLLVPRFSMGFIYRSGLKSNGEFSFGSIISSPTFVEFGMMGPDLTGYIGLKKNIFKSKTFNFSYKFNIAMEYTAIPGLELITKHFLMFGSNRKDNNFSIVFSIRSSLGTIMPFGFMMGPLFSIKDLGYATLSPVLEFSWSRYKTTGFTSNISLFCSYDITVDLVQVIERLYFPSYYFSASNCYFRMPSVSGVLNIGIKFAWQGRYIPENYN